MKAPKKVLKEFVSKKDQHQQQDEHVFGTSGQLQSETTVL
jgi:hypothetical protein